MRASWMVYKPTDELPPQTRMLPPFFRSMFKLSLENMASQAVAAAKGTVAAAAGVMLLGILKQMRSSASVYSAYAPRPLISPGTISPRVFVELGENYLPPHMRPAILSPGSMRVTLSPTDSTIPEKSHPKTDPSPIASLSKDCTSVGFCAMCVIATKA